MTIIFHEIEAFEKAATFAKIMAALKGGGGTVKRTLPGILAGGAGVAATRPVDTYQMLMDPERDITNKSTTLLGRLAEGLGVATLMSPGTWRGAGLRARKALMEQNALERSLGLPLTAKVDLSHWTPGALWAAGPKALLGGLGFGAEMMGHTGQIGKNMEDISKNTSNTTAEMPNVLKNVADVTKNTADATSQLPDVIKNLGVATQELGGAAKSTTGVMSGLSSVLPNSQEVRGFSKETVDALADAITSKARDVGLPVALGAGGYLAGSKLNDILMPRGKGDTNKEEKWKTRIRTLLPILMAAGGAAAPTFYNNREGIGNAIAGGWKSVKDSMPFGKTATAERLLTEQAKFNEEAKKIMDMSAIPTTAMGAVLGAGLGGVGGAVAGGGLGAIINGLQKKPTSDSKGRVGRYAMRGGLVGATLGLTAGGLGGYSLVQLLKILTGAGVAATTGATVGALPWVMVADGATALKNN